MQGSFLSPHPIRGTSLGREIKEEEAKVGSTSREAKNEALTSALGAWLVQNGEEQGRGFA